MSTARQYELVYILSPDATEQQIADIHAQVESITAKFSAVIERTDNWGRRRLAYKIGKFKEGVYVLEVINGGGDLVKELDRRLKVSDLVIRHLIVRVDEDLKTAARSKTRRESTTARRRAARGLPAHAEPIRKSDDDDDAEEGMGI